MIVGIPVERDPQERRVALVPAVVGSLAKAGLEVHVEPGAGEKAGFPDAAYQEQGASEVANFSRFLSKISRCGPLRLEPRRLPALRRICASILVACWLPARLRTLR